MQWILEDFWKSVFEPGVNKGLLVVMHAAFIGLMLTLLFLLVLTNFVNPHIWVLLISSLGLYLSILWYKSAISVASSHFPILGLSTRLTGKNLLRNLWNPGRKSLQNHPNQNNEFGQTIISNALDM